MKIIYEFSEEDENNLKMFQRSADFRDALWELDVRLRAIGKHEEIPTENFEDWFFRVRDDLRGIISDTGIHDI